jgi:hypothetical protein
VEPCAKPRVGHHRLNDRNRQRQRSAEPRLQAGVHVWEAAVRRRESVTHPNHANGCSAASNSERSAPALGRAATADPSDSSPES